MLGALAVHVAVILLLLLLTVVIPAHTEESGVEVMMGNTTAAYGGFNPSSLVDVDVMPKEVQTPTPPVEQSTQELITQDEEETVALTPKAEPKKEVKKPEKTEAEKLAEAKKLAEEKAARERKAAEEAANKRVAGAFGRGNEMGDRGASAGAGAEGATTGNSLTGATTGNGGYGTFDLGGRSLGEGGLPRPVYNVQDEGRVVVAITVNPQGVVINTSIHRDTNTVDPTLRKAAEDAAKKARFNAVSGLNNQSGTITYYFNLR